MAEDQSRFITKADNIAYREKQDKDLHQEFRGQESLTEKVRDDPENSTERLRDELIQRFANLDDDLKNKFGHVKDKLGYLEAGMSQINGRSYNSSRFLPHHDLAKIGVYRPDIGFESPENFPSNIREFWSLQFPRNEGHLIYLVRFFDIYGYEHWGETNFDMDDTWSDKNNPSESPDISQHKQSLEDAVRKYPQTAVEELASQLGIVTENIPNFFSQTAKPNQRPQPRPAKRPPAEGHTIEREDTKRVKRPEPELPPQPALPIHPPQSGRPTMSSFESTQTRLEWKDPAAEQARKAIMDKLEAGSPTEVNTQQT